MIVRGKASLKSFYLYLSLVSHSFRAGWTSSYEHACDHRFVPVSDTSPAAQAVQLQIYRRMSAGHQKWVAELSLEQQWKDACRGANPPDVNTAPE
jgi:hypothetical protein